jgi:hypothetical protein
LYFKSFTWKPAHGLEQYAIKIPYPEWKDGLVVLF